MRVILDAHSPFFTDGSAHSGVSPIVLPLQVQVPVNRKSVWPGDPWKASDNDAMKALQRGFA